MTKAPQDQEKETPLEQPPEEPRITLDHYESTRRRPRPPTWPYVVVMLLMAAALALLLIYQDRCGQIGSGVLFGGGQGQSQTQSERPSSPAPPAAP